MKNNQKTLTAYFEGSLAGSKEYKENYKKIISSLESYGCDVKHLIFEDNWEHKQKRTKKEATDVYNKILKEITSADFLVAEMTFGSPSVAMEISEAINKYKKPVLMLYHESKQGTPGAPFRGNSSKLLFIEKYSFSNLDHTIKKFLERVKSKIPSAKFTVRLSEELNEYTEHLKNKWNESSKNQTLLRILQERMDQDYEYGFKKA